MLKNIRILQLSVADKIIVLNVFFFVICHFLALTGFISIEKINSWVGLPETFSDVIVKPWLSITYAFLHANLSHLFWNMIFLYFIGQVFLNLFTEKQFVAVYFSGILFGSLIFLLFYHIFPSFIDNSVVLGASGAIMALVLFCCVIAPTYEIHLFFAIRVKLWAFAAILLLIDIMGFSSNTGGKIMHFAGAFTGVFAAFLVKKYGWDLFNFFAKIPLKFPTFKIFKKKEKEKLQKNRKIVSASKSSTKLSDAEKIRMHNTNIILDKISKSGYGSLTDDEKKYLFETSKKLNKK